MSRPKKTSLKLLKPSDQGEPQLYTLEVFLLSGPLTKKFVKKNREISRTIQIPQGHQAGW